MYNSLTVSTVLRPAVGKFARIWPVLEVSAAPALPRSPGPRSPLPRCCPAHLIAVSSPCERGARREDCVPGTLGEAKRSILCLQLDDIFATGAARATPSRTAAISIHEDRPRPADAGSPATPRHFPGCAGGRAPGRRCCP